MINAIHPAYNTRFGISSNRRPSKLTTQQRAHLESLRVKADKHFKRAAIAGAVSVPGLLYFGQTTMAIITAAVITGTGLMLRRYNKPL